MRRVVLAFAAGGPASTGNGAAGSKSGEAAGLAPHVRRIKRRLLSAPFEVCLARARHFTASYRETEGLDPALRNALALRRTLERQRIFIEPDERLAGSKTEKGLAGPLPVERGDFLRALQLELDILERKQRPFRIGDEDRRVFREEIVPYWDGRTVRDEKVREWRRRGLLDDEPGLAGAARSACAAIRFFRYIGRDNLRRIAAWLRRHAPSAPLALHPFHRLAAAKQALFDRPYAYRAARPVTRESLAEIARALGRLGVRADEA